MDTFLQALAFAIATAATSTYVAVKLLSQSVKEIKRDVDRLASAIEGPHGLHVKVARLERQR